MADKQREKIYIHTFTPEELETAFVFVVEGKPQMICYKGIYFGLRKEDRNIGYYIGTLESVAGAQKLVQLDEESVT